MLNLRASLAFVSFLLVAASASALINLQFRPSTQTAKVGSLVSVGVYGVATTANETLIAFDLYVQWDSPILGAISASDAGAPTYLYSGFHDDPTIPDANDSLADGDAYDQVGTPLGVSVPVSTSGTLLTTFGFTPLAGGLANVRLVASSGTRYPGPPSQTDVFDANANLVTGSLGSATINVQAVPEPPALLAVTAGVAVLLRRRRR